MKQRFSSLDVKVIAHELQESLTSLRLANVHDLSSKILLFKFSKPDHKRQLIIDTGFRCHLTDFARTTAAAPSAFASRLRKYLKARRLTSVSQVGTDRILEFQFNDGQYRLFLEFFASGNIILTDADLKILVISRNVSEGEAQEQQKIGLPYSLESRQNSGGIPPMTKDRVKDALVTAVKRADANAKASAQTGKKIKSKIGGDLRKGLAVSINEIPPVLVESLLQEHNFNIALKPEEVLESESLLDSLFKCLLDARQVVDNITASAVCTGYIFAKRKPGVAEAGDEFNETKKREYLLYEDFHPFVPPKMKADPSIEILEFQGYNQTVDEFFSSLEGQKLESRLLGREEAARRKLEAARQDQAKRIEGLQDAQAMNQRKAAAIEANVERVQEAMDAVNGLLTQGMDWVNIGKLVERERKKQNPVAQIINLPLKLEENTITLSLAEEAFDQEDNEEEEEDNPYATDGSDSEAEDAKAETNRNTNADKTLTVDILLNLSPWGNAREYYEQRRTAAVKEDRTQMQAAKALKSTEKKIDEELKKGLKQEKALLQPLRKQMWFEKFTWFISSDGHLVIGGKDSHQNEMIYKKYLRKGDVYCHADLHGAASVVIKNNPKTPDAPIPPATLAQAGSLSVCSSSAWDSKAGMGAWWVNADQVSKSAQSGEFLPIGSFMIKGKKNFLPPTQLLIGLGVMFKISEESKAKHVKHRLQETTSDEENAADLPDETDAQPESQQADEGAEAGTIDSENELDEDSDSAHEDNEQRDNPLQSSYGGDNNADELDRELSALQIVDADDAHEEFDKEEGHNSDEGDPDELAEEKSPARDDDVADDEETISESVTVATEISPQEIGTSKGAATAKKGQPKRGQKGKAKKIAQKYKGQDEEDRAAAEALIGATAGRQKAEAEAVAKQKKQLELEAAKERRRAQHQKQQKEGAQQEELRRAMMDEGIDAPDDDEMEKMTMLDALVGTPLPGDEILEAIPVCAPWNAMSKLKYKVKLQPGATKKGKAVKEILERWKADSGKKGVLDPASRDKEKMWPREVQLIKAFKAEEVVNSVPVGKVRVMLAGGGGGGGSGKGRGGGGGQKGQSKGGKGGKGSKK